MATTFHGPLQRAFTVQNDTAGTIEDDLGDLKLDGNNNPIVPKYPRDWNAITEFPVEFSWDWPFCDEGVARGLLTEHRFIVSLPFSKGTGSGAGIIKKFHKISESNFSYSIGLQNGDNDCGANFWRLEIEVLRNLNMLSLIASRDISRRDESTKRLRRVRKVYRLPDQFDVSTLQTSSTACSICLQAGRRILATRRPRSSSTIPMKRAASIV